MRRCVNLVLSIVVVSWTATETSLADFRLPLERNGEVLGLFIPA